MKLDRRDFLKVGLSSLTYFTTATTVPLWVAKSARALSKNLADDRILVIVQMGGGNDGLNTVIPYTDPLYNGPDLRPTLHITSGLEATTIDSLNALHPKLVRLKDWYDNGNVAVINNVGYPNPNLSHFTSSDFWELGMSTGSALTATEGWMARFFDNQCAGMPADQIPPLSAVAGGQFLVPLTLRGSSLYQAPAIYDPEWYSINFPWEDYGALIKQYLTALNNTNSVNSTIDFLQRSSNLAQTSVEDIAAAEQLPIINTFPEGDLGRGLTLASKIIRGGFDTKIFYVSQSGYDTHANQFGGDDPGNTGDHPVLLDEFDQCMHAFLADMAASGNLSKVVLMTFSEFGRRVYENNSFGTDHGAGNCMFVMGGKVNSGVYGGQPNLEEDSLLDGSLSHAIDFRSVYARIAQDWLKGDAEALFGADDFNDPVLDIQGGMEQLPIFDLAPPTIGDVNGDLNVDAIDIQFVINGALGQETGMETDINADEQTNAVDVQLVINAALGKKSIAKRNTAVPKSRAPRKRGNTPRLAGPVPEHMLGKKLR